jgi:starch synthase
MPAKKILFVNQEITPYVDSSHMSVIGRYLPQSIQDRGVDIRTFMPKFGVVNDRRNQLHDVIRLSGQNININGNDHPLIIKVASIQSVRMQTYFIENEKYFLRTNMMHDKSGKFHADNDERAIFYAIGVLETVKNLGWSPDIIHCHGWISSLIPLYIREIYGQNPLFAKAKLVYSVYDDAFERVFRSLPNKLKSTGIAASTVKHYKQATFASTTQSTLSLCDAAVISHENVGEEICRFISDSGKPFFTHRSEQYADDYLSLYNSLAD